MGFNWGLGDFLAGFQVLVILVAGVFFVERGALTEGEFLAFNRLQPPCWCGPSRNLGRLLAELSKTSISATRLFEILDAPEERSKPKALRPPHGRGRIVFDQVSFGYNQSRGAACSTT